MLRGFLRTVKIPEDQQFAVDWGVAPDLIMTSTSVERDLRSLLGTQEVQPWIDNAQIWVAYPTSQALLDEVLTLAHRNRWRVLPMGTGTKIAWGGLVQDVTFAVSLARLNRLIDHAQGDMTVTAEAGMPLAQLQSLLAPARQRVALDPHYPGTLGGVLATADSGPLRHRYGGVRDLCLGITVVRADGQRAKAGGRVVKNVAGYDLMKLFTGSYGTLGIVSEMTLRLHPLAATSQTLVLTGELATTLGALLRSSLTPTAVDLLARGIVSALGLGDQLGLAVRFEGSEAGVSAQTEQLLKLAQPLKAQLLKDWPPSQALLWQGSDRIIVKCAVPVTAAVDLIQAVDSGILHGGSLGYIRIPLTPDPLPMLQKLRAQCEQVGGYLSVLEAQPEVKATFDSWGYRGNALSLMKQLKAQFDPLALLNPGRFVGGI